MPSAMIVRLCTAEDLSALPAGEAQQAVHYQWQLQGDYLFAVAYRDDQQVGVCSLDYRTDNDLRPELRDLLVYPEFRRQGAARALTTFLEDRAVELGFVEVFLKVDPENSAAIPMYIGLDYTPTGDHVLAVYERTDASGQLIRTERMDAVYRKSLLAR